MGWSLRALRDFPRKSLITQYVGVLVNSRDVETMHPHDKQHLLSLRGGQYIDGIKNPFLGCGAGSFANSSSTANAEVWQTEYGVFLRALVDIAEGGWIMINYKSSLNEEFF